MIKFVLVAFFKALTLQFTKAPHYVEESVKTEKGHTVNFKTGAGASVSYTKATEKGKDIFTINIQVPAGPNLRVPTSVAFASNEDRDAVSEAIKEAYGKLEDSVEDGVEVVIPKASK